MFPSHDHKLTKILELTLKLDRGKEDDFCKYELAYNRFEKEWALVQNTRLMPNAQELMTILREIERLNLIEIEVVSVEDRKERPENIITDERLLLLRRMREQIARRRGI